MSRSGRQCCCCDWCLGDLDFADIVALFTFYGWTNGAGSGIACGAGHPCSGEDGTTYASDEWHTVNPASPATLPPCDFAHTPDSGPICYYRRTFAYCTATAVTSDIDMRFYHYRSGGNMRGAVFVTVTENTGSYATAMADFLISTGSAKVDCLAFALEDEPLTICDSSGTMQTCNLPTTLDLAMAEA